MAAVGVGGFKGPLYADVLVFVEAELCGAAS